MTRVRRAAWGARLLGLSCAAILTSAVARAEPPPPKREVPDYDGRDEPPNLGREIAIGVPRVLLSPLWLASELIRQPLGWAVASAERAGLPETLYDLFTFGPERQAGFAPIAFIDFGFDPSVGVYVFWNDAFFENHDLRLRASTWGSDWIAASLSNRINFGSDPDQPSWVGFHATAIRRPDYVYFGEGPRTLDSEQGRYGATSIDGGAEVDFDLWRSSRLYGALGVRSVDFRPGNYHGQTTVDERVAEGVYPEPAAYATGYTSIYNRLHLAVDSRRPRPASGSGVRLELRADQGSDVRQSPGSGFLRYTATFGGFYDLNDRGRVVSLSAAVQFSDPLGEQPVPFTELVTLGGEGPMRGFVPGRLVGRSGAVALLRYRWPIWAWIDGSIQFAIGNVFGPHLQGFELDLLRFSGAIGIESVGSPDSSLELLFGLGSETFEHGTQITSLRVVVGTNHGF